VQLLKERRLLRTSHGFTLLIHVSELSSELPRSATHPLFEWSATQMSHCSHPLTLAAFTLITLFSENLKIPKKPINIKKFIKILLEEKY
jgi:hypothetical protein